MKKDLKDYCLRPGSADYLQCKSIPMGIDTGTGRTAMQYSGDELLGIATMHKSNAVPITKGSDMAKATAQMRRG